MFNFIGKDFIMSLDNNNLEESVTSVPSGENVAWN